MAGTPPEVKPVRNPEIKYTQIFINNEFVNSASGKTFPTINPTTEQKICDVQEGYKADIDAAVAAAKKAFEIGSEWRTMDAAKRAKLLLKLGELFERDIQYLASLETLDMGKLFLSSVGDIRSAVDVLQYMAGWADKVTGDVIPAAGDYFTFTRREPVGVVGAILPWNYPVYLTSMKIAPALATGCTVVLKPAEQSPLTALYIAALCREAGIPKGVVNVVPGYGPTAGAALVSHMDVNKISFTGSTEVGRSIMVGSGTSNLKRVNLELGGKSPVVVFADCDLERAVEICHNEVMCNQGQCCVAGTRTFVQEEIYDKFVKLSTERAKQRTTGDPYEDVENGPQVDKEQFDKVLGFIEKGKEQGATLTTGGERSGDKGYFIKPTVFANVEDHMDIAKQEIFGPVQQIIKFKTMEEAIERANTTEYGLGAGVFTSDFNKAITFVQAVKAGTVWVNEYNNNCPACPFGGFKMSGIGRENGASGIEHYLETKTVIMKIPQKNS